MSNNNKRTIQLIVTDFDIDDLLGDGSSKQSKPGNQSAKSEATSVQSSRGDRSKFMKDLFGLEGEKKKTEADTSKLNPSGQKGTKV